MPAAHQRRPNFLLFVTDQHRADHLGCYGNADVRTPHIDALAAAGCRFDDFHVATPICQPNRASLMTGRLPSAHGLRMNGRELSLGERSFVQTLREAGWRTALVGKSHLQNITTAPTAWPAAGQRLPHEAITPYPGRYGQEVWKRWEDDPAFELDLPYYGFEQVVLTIGHGDQQHGHWRRWLRAQVADAERLIGPQNAIPTPGLHLGRLGQAWRTRLPEELHPTRYIAEQTCDMLARLAQRDGAPFFLQCSFPDPHHPFTPPGRYWDMFRPDDVSLPATFGAELVDPPPALAYLREQRRSDPDFRPAFGSFACSEQEAREAIALNHGNLALIDDGIGRVLADLDLLGKIRVVLITNGSMSGKPRVQAALRRLAELSGEIWFKVDSVTSEGTRRINSNAVPPAEHLAKLRAAAELCPTWVQTCVFAWQGEPPSDAEMAAYVDAIAGLCEGGVPLQGVLLYTLARPSLQPEAPDLSAVSEAWMDALAARLRARGVQVRVSA